MAAAKVEIPDALSEWAKRRDTTPRELVGEAIDEWLARQELAAEQRSAPPRWEKIAAGRERSFLPRGGGLYHDFLLVNREQYGYNDYLQLLHSPEAVRLHDDLLRYIGDTLGWLPTLNPDGRGATPGHGLHWHGPTVLEKDGARVLCRLLVGWESVFAEAPDTFVLTGAYWACYLPGEDETDGDYQRLVFVREEAIWLLGELRRLASAVDEKHYLLHLGI